MRYFLSLKKYLDEQTKIFGVRMEKYLTCLRKNFGAVCSTTVDN